MTTNERRRAALHISRQYWEESPEIRAYIARTFVMVAFQFNVYQNRFEAILDHPDFPEIKEGQAWPILEITITRREGQEDLITWSIPDLEARKRDFQEWLTNKPQKLQP